MSQLDLILHGGTVVTPTGPQTLSIGVADGKIVQLAPEIHDSARQHIEAPGKYIIPGIIDAQVQFNEPGREDWEGLTTGPRALAAGGGTTFFDLPHHAAPPTLDRKSFDLKRGLAEAKSCLDFALWGGLVPDNLVHLEELSDCGVIGYKAFMSDSGTSDFPRVEPRHLKAGMKKAAAFGLPVGVHAEDHALISRLTGQARTALKMGIADYLASRPIDAELEAIRTALDIAGETRCKLHIVHVSCPEGIDLIQEGKKQGIDVTAETGPHYLLLNDKDAQEIGAPAKCAPPLRDQGRVKKMWERLAAGLITTLASDHSPSPPSMKTSPDFFAVWGGLAGCQHGFLLTLAEIVHQRVPSIPLEQFAAVTARQVADRFQLSTTKGKIALSHDADFIVIDLSSGEKIEPGDLHYRHKISPYIGRKVDVLLQQTWLRGQLVYDRAGRVPFPPVKGRFLQPERR